MTAGQTNHTKFASRPENDPRESKKMQFQCCEKSTPGKICDECETASRAYSEAMRDNPKLTQLELALLALKEAQAQGYELEAARAEAEIARLFEDLEQRVKKLSSIADNFDQECADTDRLLRGMSLDPDRHRTEGGRLQVLKILNALTDQRIDSLRAERAKHEVTRQSGELAAKMLVELLKQIRLAKGRPVTFTESDWISTSNAAQTLLDTLKEKK